MDVKQRITLRREQLEKKLYKHLPGPKHHKLPKSYNDPREEEYITGVFPKDHKSWHYLVGNSNPTQVRKLFQKDLKTYRPEEMLGKKIILRCKTKEVESHVKKMPFKKRTYIKTGIERLVVFENFIGKKTVPKFLNWVNLSFLHPDCELLLVSEKD